MKLPTTRTEARAQGLKHYFIGKPCSKGHLSNRHLTGTCVDCQQIANQGWAARNPGEGTRRSLEWQRRNPEKARVKNLKYRREKDGVPEPDYPAPENCELCEKILQPGKTHLDHDHATGKFRGWLCNTCNLALGHLGDTAASLRRAVAYLERT